MSMSKETAVVSAILMIVFLGALMVVAVGCGALGAWELYRDGGDRLRGIGFVLIAGFLWIANGKTTTTVGTGRQG